MIPDSCVATDGTVISDLFETGESMVTGEVMPVRKLPDSSVVAGSLNCSDALLVRLPRCLAITQPARSQLWSTKPGSLNRNYTSLQIRSPGTSYQSLILLAVNPRSHRIMFRAIGPAVPVVMLAGWSRSQTRRNIQSPVNRLVLYLRPFTSFSIRPEPD